MNLLESSASLSGRSLASFQPSPPRILCFVETPNQLYMARETARYMARDMRLEVFVIQKIHRIPPHLLLEASQDLPIYPVDRNGISAVHDAEILFCVREWFKSVIHDYAGLLMFNDGTRVSMMVGDWARQMGRPVTVIQDGVLGHVTNPGLSSYPAFLAIHSKLLASQFLFLEAVANVTDAAWAARHGAPVGMTLQKLYDLHCASTKIGAGKADQYFVHNQDIRIKTAIRHALPAQSIAVTGSFHANPAPAGVSARPAGDVLYVGQCHTRHGKARLDDWLNDFRQIADALADQDVVYRFHPGELPSTRKLLAEIIDGRFRIDTTGILRASDLGSYKLIISETSSVTFDAIRCGIPAIVIEAPCLAERLPRVDHPLLIYTTPTHLRHAARATLAGHTPKAVLPLELQASSFIPQLSGFDEPLRRWVRKIAVNLASSPETRHQPDHDDSLSQGIVALPLEEILADARSVYDCDKPEWDGHYCSALLEKLGLANLTLWYVAMWEADWAHRLLRQIVVNRVADEARLHYLIARTFADLDPESHRSLIGSTRSAPFRDILFSVRALSSPSDPVRLPDFQKRYASSPIWGALYARAVRRGLVADVDGALLTLVEQRHVSEFMRAASAAAARSRTSFGTYLADFLIGSEIEERHLIHRMLAALPASRLAMELPDLVAALIAHNAPDVGKDYIKLIAKIAEYADRHDGAELADMILGVALTQKPRSKRLLRTRLILAVRRTDVSGFQDALASLKAVSPAGIVGLVGDLRERLPEQTEAILSTLPDIAD